MKTKISVLVLFFMIISGSPVKYAHGSGIPTVDIAAIMQQLTSYLQQIKEYSEIVELKSVSDSQYFQMIKEYQQVLREYNHYLNQLKGIQHMIDAKDWKMIVKTIKSYYGKSKRSLILTMNPDDSDYEENMDRILKNYGHVPRDPLEVQNDAQALGIWSDQYRQEVEEDYYQYNLYKDRMRMVSKNSRDDMDFQSAIDVHKNNFDRLGDESDLATMQEIAAQNLTIMKQNRVQLQTLNQMLLNMETQESLRAAKRAKARDAEIKRLKNRKNCELLGRDRWGSF